MNWWASTLRGSTHPTETAFIDPINLIARLHWLRIVLDLEAEGSLMTAQVHPMRDRKGQVYTPAVGPRLRPLLWMILIGSAVIDGLLYLWVGDVVVCYRCLAHHRGVPVTAENPPFELGIAERYRQERIRREQLLAVKRSG